MSIVAAAAVVAAVGEVDSACIAEFDRAVEQAMDDADQRSHSRVVVDLEDVEFMSSAGMQVIIQAHRRARSRGVELRAAASARRIVRRALDLLELASYFHIYPDREHALDVAEGR